MSILHRIDDAKLLFKNGRMEGAFLNILVAVAASAHKAHKKLGDREAFEKFLEGTQADRFRFEYRGQPQKLSYILYKWMRCKLVHEGALPLDLQLMPDLQPGTCTIRAGGAPERILKISHGYFFQLIQYVVEAPVNADLFHKKVDKS